MSGKGSRREGVRGCNGRVRGEDVAECCWVNVRMRVWARSAGVIGSVRVVRRAVSVVRQGRYRESGEVRGERFMEDVDAVAARWTVHDASMRKFECTGRDSEPFVVKKERVMRSKMLRCRRKDPCRRPQGGTSRRS